MFKPKSIMSSLEFIFSKPKLIICEAKSTVLKAKEVISERHLMRDEHNPLGTAWVGYFLIVPDRLNFAEA